MKYEIETTQDFDKWLRKIRDKTILYRFDVRFNRVAKGNFGDVKQIDTNLFELRFSLVVVTVFIIRLGTKKS